MSINERTPHLLTKNNFHQDELVAERQLIGFSLHWLGYSTKKRPANQLVEILFVVDRVQSSDLNLVCCSEYFPHSRSHPHSNQPLH